MGGLGRRTQVQLDPMPTIFSRTGRRLSWALATHVAVSITGLVLALAPFPTATPPSDASTATHPCAADLDIPDEEVAAMAERLGIPPDEARARLVVQRKACVVGVLGPVKFPVSWASMWWSDQQGLLKIAFTQSASSKAGVLAAAAGLPSDRWDAVEVKYSLAELQQFEADVSRERASIYRERGLSYGVGIDARANAVLLMLQDATPAGRSYLELRYGDRVVVYSEKYEGQEVACANRTDCGNPLRGGIKIRGSGGAGPCSSGFTAQGGGKPWLLTAAHCLKDQYWHHNSRRIGPWRKRQNYDRIDAGKIQETSSYWNTSNKIYRSDYAKRYSIRRVGKRNELYRGMSICRSGYRTSKRCGVVKVVYYDPPPASYASNHENLLRVSKACARGGDSGGPVYTGHSARALVEGGSRGDASVASCDDSDWYHASHIGYVEDLLNVHVKASG